MNKLYKLPRPCYMIKRASNTERATIAQGIAYMTEREVVAKGLTYVTKKVTMTKGLAYVTEGAVLEREFSSMTEGATRTYHKRIFFSVSRVGLKD